MIRATSIMLHTDDNARREEREEDNEQKDQKRQRQQQQKQQQQSTTSKTVLIGKVTVGPTATRTTNPGGRGRA